MILIKMQKDMCQILTNQEHHIMRLYQINLGVRKKIMTYVLTAKLVMTELQMLFVNILKIKSNKYVNIGHSQSNTIKYGGIFNVDFSTGLVTATELNVRSGPGTQYKIVTTVKKNEYIRVFAGVGNWYIVQVEGDYVGAVSQKMVDNNYFAHESPIYGSPFNMLKSFKISYKTAGENIAGNSSNSGAVTSWMNSSGHKANILNSNFNYTGVGVVSSSKYGKIFVQMFIGK